MTKRNTDHCVYGLETGRFRCNRCGEEHALPLPMDVEEVGRSAKAFTQLHRGCTPKEGS